MEKHIVYIDKANSSLSYEKNNLRVEVDGKLVKRVPLTLIDSLIVYGNAEIHSSIFHHCAQNDVSITFCKANSEDLQMMLPKSHNDVKTKLRQYAIYNDDNARLIIAKSMLKMKIDQQLALLNRLCPTTSKNTTAEIGALSSNIMNSTSISQLMGYEGIIARYYFSEFTKLFAHKWGFKKRNKFYTIITKQCSMIAHARGLDTRIGFLHEVHFGRDSFACDLVEGVRFIVDELVYDLFQNEYFNLDDFNITDNGCLLTKSGRVKIFSQVSLLKLQSRKIIQENLALLGLI
jgi:CRISPR-associated protein Cas1